MLSEPRRWQCPSCLGESEEVESGPCDLPAPEAQKELPTLGWRMQRGRFLEIGWAESLVSEDQKAVARKVVAVGREGEPRAGISRLGGRLQVRGRTAGYYSSFLKDRIRRLLAAD